MPATVRIKDLIKFDRNMKISGLTAHERTIAPSTYELKKELVQTRLFRPIVIDDIFKIILDGHHRVSAYRMLGRETIPVVYVNLFDPRVVLHVRKPEFEYLDKPTLIDIVVKRGEKFPPKITQFLYNIGTILVPIGEMYQINFDGTISFDNRWIPHIQ